MSDEIVMNFGDPHRIGSVCRFPCSQCHETIDNPGSFALADPSGPTLANKAPAFLILREATRLEYEGQCFGIGVPAPDGINYWVRIVQD